MKAAHGGDLRRWDDVWGLFISMQRVTVRDRAEALNPFAVSLGV
jgi:hypothetical protein